MDTLLSCRHIYVKDKGKMLVQCGSSLLIELAIYSISDTLFIPLLHPKAKSLTPGTNQIGVQWPLSERTRTNLCLDLNIRPPTDPCYMYMYVYEWGIVYLDIGYMSSKYDNITNSCICFKFEPIHILLVAVAWMASKLRGMTTLKMNDGSST